MLVCAVFAHLALTAAPAIAASIYSVRRGVNQVPIVLGIALVASGVCAYSALTAYYVDPVIGIAWDALIVAGSIALAVFSWRGGELDRSALTPLATPLLLWVIATCFVTFLGFLHGATELGVGMSPVRFSSQLPSDNDMPRFFTEWFAAHGHSGTPPVYPGDWLMSDRPPLQVGYALSQHAFFNTASYLHYQVLCVALQQLWVVGMWAVLVAAGLPARTRGLAMVATMISDIAIVHGFFVWPKLLGAAFVLAALAIVISPSWSAYRRDLRVAALVAALLALAMLAHGSSIFGVIPLVLLAVFRGVSSLRWIGAGLLVGLSLYAPWAAYQHYGDPPGNRLLKWQLGGLSEEINSEGTLESIERGYRQAGVSGTLNDKESNFEAMAGLVSTKRDFEATVDDLEAGHLGLALEPIRDARFFSLLPFLGLFLVGPLAMLASWRRKRPDAVEWSFALRALGFVVVACIFWGLLLFGGPGSTTSIHLGSLAVPLLAVCACVVGLHSLYPRFATALVAVNVAAVLILYAPSLQPVPGTSYSVAMALLVLASLAALLVVLFGPPPSRVPKTLGLDVRKT